MCVPGCQEALRRDVSRRGFFKGVGAATVAAATMQAAPVLAQGGSVSFSRVADLTHPLPPDFPTFFGEPQLEMQRTASFDPDGLNMFRWVLDEHTGTHMDAPLHFSADGADASTIPVDRLVVPLIVVDIRAKAAEDPDAQVTPDDLTAWEAANGDIPAGCCVAMQSGWADFVNDPKFRNADDDGTMHFPGFHPEAAALMIERDVAGMAVDTLSLDFGASADFMTHRTWLGSGRWGMECVANLDAVPVTGATLVVGGPKIVGATGGPSRLFALM